MIMYLADSESNKAGETELNEKMTLSPSSYSLLSSFSSTTCRRRLAELSQYARSTVKKAVENIFFLY